MKIVQRIIAVYLIFMIAGAWGVMVGKYEWFPYKTIESVISFYNGYPGEDTTLIEKLMNDSGGIPRRFMFKFASLDKTGMQEVPVPGLKERRANPLMRLSPEAPKGYRMLFGAYDFEETMWGALLLDADGKLINTWHLSTDDLPLSTDPSFRKNMNGTAIHPDGSVIFLMADSGGGIVKVDYCGNKLWTLEGLYHHAISPTDDGHFWTFEGLMVDFDHILARVDTKTGKVVKRIDMKDVRYANPNVHIFDLQQQRNVIDRVHGNDIEQLPNRLAADFPQFVPGDLLISFKTVNLVFVLDPESLKIKWWRIGPWDAQHDPDWNKGGLISVYSNNQRGVGDHSNIITIDPKTYEANVAVPGIKYNFFSGSQGSHHVNEMGTTLVTSPKQGRIFEVNKNGDVVFDFINLYTPETNQTLQLAAGFHLEPDYFDFDTPPKCEKP